MYFNCYKQDQLKSYFNIIFHQEVELLVFHVCLISNCFHGKSLAASSQFLINFFTILFIISLVSVSQCMFITERVKSD